MFNNMFLFVLLALIAEIIGTISGFGSSILFVPLASLFFDFKTVLGITAVFHVFSNISKIILFRQGIDRQIALRLGIPAVLCVIPGAWLTAFVPARQMELLMNIVLLLLSVYLAFNFNRTLKQSNFNLYAGGASSGFLAGLVGTGGAIRGLTLVAFNLPKTIFIATSALIDLGVDSARAAIYLGNGYFRRELFFLVPLLLLVGILGSYLGKRILRHTSETLFRYVVLFTIIGTSLFEMLKYFSASGTGL